jgi:hypothetical protein
MKKVKEKTPLDSLESEVKNVNETFRLLELLLPIVKSSYYVSASGQKNKGKQEAKEPLNADIEQIKFTYTKNIKGVITKIITYNKEVKHEINGNGKKEFEKKDVFMENTKCYVRTCNKDVYLKIIRPHISAIFLSCENGHRVYDTDKIRKTIFTNFGVSNF